MKSQKTCVLLSPKKMVQTETCSAPLLNQEFPQTNNQRQKRLARILDPHYESLTQKSKSGDPFVGTP
jgi:hypothetical protein